MAERLYLTFENRFEVPPPYALAWLTDFRPEDMRDVQGEKAPTIRVTRLPDGRIQREFSMMGLAITTRTTVESAERWVAVMEVKNRKGKLLSRGRIVEEVRAEGSATAHRATLFTEDLTFMAKVMSLLGKGAQRSDVGKLFAHNKKEMEAAFRAGKPPTS